MRKNLKAKIISLILCIVVVFLCVCGCDLGITKQDDQDDTPTEGFAGIGNASKAYDGLFNGITDIKITIGSAELSTVLDHADAGMYCECSAHIGDDLMPGIGIKPKGNTTYIKEVGNNRYSFKLKFNKYTKGQKLNGLDEIDLNNMSYDPSYIREYLAYVLFSLEGGIEAPLASFARLYINNEYYGLYLMTESIDESFLKRCFGDADGDLYEADIGSALISSDTSTFTLKKGEDTSLSKITALYNALADGIVDDILDAESVLRYAAVIDVICAAESYLGPKAENYYLYSDSDGTIHIIPHDFKLSFGTNAELKKIEYQIDTSLYTSSVEEPYFGLSAEDRPLVSILLEDQTYFNDYLSYVKFYTEALSDILTKLPELKAAIDDAVKDDAKRFFEDDVYEAEFVEGDSLYGFINARCKSISAQLAEIE